MSNGFVHSVKVPRIYKFTADIVRHVQEDGASLKTLIYEKKHPNVHGIYGLSMNTLQVLPQLDQLLGKTQILTEQPRLDPWLARVLITELLWGKKCLRNRSKPVLTVLAYEDKLREELTNLDCPEIFIPHKKKVRKPRYVRVNTLLLSVEKAISLFQEEGWQLLPRSTTYSSYLQTLSQLSEPYFIQDLHIPEVLAFPASTSFHEHDGYQKGKLILQDKASCLPVHLLDPTTGSVILDMCAAPGMKVTHVAAKLQNFGKVYAVEIDTKRFETLLNQIEITRSFCVKPLNQDALTIDPKRYSQVEYILVDPSCSGSGIVDRPKQSNMDSKTETKRLQNLQSIQVYLLRYALLNFPNAKRIIYSTCSLHPEENEEVIDEVLADIGNAYCLVPAKQLLKDKWINFSSKKYNCEDKCLYSKPDVDFCTGFFLAVFERNFDVTLPKCKRKGGNVNPIKANLDIKRDDTVKKIEYKQKIHGQNKNKNKEKISMTDVVLDVKNKITTKRNKKEIEKVDVYLVSNFNNEKIALNKSEDMKMKKSGQKRKSKYENVSQAKKNKEMVEVYECEETQERQKDEETEPSKKKKKKKQKIDVIKIDGLEEKRKNVETLTELSKKK